MERIIPAELDGDELWRRNGEYVDAASYDAAVRHIAELEAALAWYRDQSTLCRLVHSGGDAGRHALAADGGNRARAVLETKK